MSVSQGMRPTQPLPDFSTKRGLSDDIWSLIEQCWAQNSTERPTATQVVERLRSLPERPTDRRPYDNITVPSQVAYNKVNHPFSTLAQNSEDTDMDDLKWISGSF